ncbi:glycosyltransferase family 2 protein [bacterium]|nr:glycosyltransferase family 2 protein [bacterium]
MKILVFIPTFNDRLLIPSLVESVLALGVEFNTLVIDDGSDPAIVTNCISGHRQRYFRCPYNVGLGVAMNIALDYAHEEQFDIFLRIDADGQHAVECLLPIVEEMVVRGADVMIGARSNNFSFDSSRSIAATVLKRHMNVAANWASGLRLDEWHSGLIVLSREAIERLHLQEYERYPEVEVLLRAVQLHLKVDQFLITQKKRTHGRSTITLSGGIHLALQFYMLLLRHLLERRS